LKKIIVVGTTASGKSTFSKELAAKLNYSYISLDFLFWKPNWQESTDEEFFEKVKKAVEVENWVLDGNYGRTNHLTWCHSDAVVWIDMPFWLNLYQNVSRSVRRAIKREELWKGTGNKESFLRMFSRDSIILWLFKTYKTNVKRYEARMVDPQYSHIKFYRLKSRAEQKAFLEDLKHKGKK
jgi:adenylate kinase family enzyme